MTIRWLPAAAGAVCLLQLSSASVAHAQSGSPPVTPDASGTATPSTGDAEAPPEMTFGHGAAPPMAPTSAATPTPQPPPPPREPRRARTMEEVTEASVGELSIRSTRWRYSLNFFGDISLSGGHPDDADHKFGFAFGAQDLLIRGDLNNNIVATTEIALEPGPDSVGVDIERFNLRWQSGSFFIEAGRTHTAFGYWNNAYHHGRWLQPTIERPRWVAFEDDGGILPVHWVGAGAGARLPVGAATLNLLATVGNGRGHIVDDVRNAGDYQAMKAFHASAEVVGIGVPELRAGVAGIYDRIPGWTDRLLLPNLTINETILSAHAAYVNVPLLFIAEGYLVTHTAAGQRWTTYGGFALLGYTFGRVTPYVEIERIASKGGPDPFLTITTAGSESGSFDTIEGIGGMRLDLTDWTALKAEYRQTRAQDTRTTVYEGVLNWSWGF